MPVVALRISQTILINLLCLNKLTCIVGWVVQSVQIEKFDFLIATFNFLCVFVCRKRICKKFFQETTIFDLEYTKEILKNTKDNIGQRNFSVFTP